MTDPTPRDAAPLLLAENVAKSFWLEQRRIDVLRSLSLRVEKGQSIAIIGASGAGKSTLLQLLGTLDIPTEGRLTLSGHDILQMSEEALAALRNRTIGFVFQAHYLLSEFSALENVMMPALIQRMSRHLARDRAKELLDWVGLSHRLEHRPGELSGGERQRVALCRALVMRPNLLLADEPTGNLDHKTGEGIHKLIEELNDRWGVTSIVVTHNLSLAERMQRTFRLEQGQLFEQAPATPPREDG
ncbi:MAG: ABC transporter ATP-binding protein [Myxococcales bacterium]|nr:ABC transporter ATP-binding protein [Myxococcales bacterium]MCB9644730.1 ABC transporter ATP-binding protein [Myxococcales bacterium]